MRVTDQAQGLQPLGECVGEGRAIIPQGLQPLGLSFPLLSMDRTVSATVSSPHRRSTAYRQSAGSFTTMLPFSDLLAISLAA